MKKSTLSVIVIVIIIIIGIIVYGRSASQNPAANNGNGDITGASVPVVPTSETKQVSGKLSSYHNDELGFQLSYPTAWNKDETASGVSFIMPIDQTQVSTIAKLQADVVVVPGKCAFPPVTTVKDRGTLTVGSNTLNTISISNNVQGRSYFNRMYSLQQGDVCYTFVLSTIAQSPSSKNLTGSNLTQAQNNNKAIVNTADTDFTNMVKSFSFVQGPAGVDETKAPKK